ncbi:hypothetical protein VTI74DRAFT_9664 [Chaetomium olivicolor]
MRHGLSARKEMTWIGIKTRGRIPRQPERAEGVYLGWGRLRDSKGQGVKMSVGQAPSSRRRMPGVLFELTLSALGDGACRDNGGSDGIRNCFSEMAGDWGRISARKKDGKISVMPLVSCLSVGSKDRMLPDSRDSITTRSTTPRSVECLMVWCLDLWIGCSEANWASSEPANVRYPQVAA